MSKLAMMGSTSFAFVRVSRLKAPKTLFFSKLSIW